MRPELWTFAALLLAVSHLPSAAAAPSLQLHERHDHHDHHESVDVGVVTTSSDSASASAPSTVGLAGSSSLSAGSHPVMSDHHGGHGHGGHHKAQLQLNDTDVHYYHHFPPSYLAADFRLDQDQVIFGEELDDDWNAKEAGGHRTLAFVHAGSFVLAYFGVLPIGESSPPGRIQVLG